MFVFFFFLFPFLSLSSFSLVSFFFLLLFHRLVNLSASYVDAINSGGVPTISSAWERVVESQCTDASEEAFNEYQSLMRSSQRASSEDGQVRLLPSFVLSPSFLFLLCFVSVVSFFLYISSDPLPPPFHSSASFTLFFFFTASRSQRYSCVRLCRSSLRACGSICCC